MKLSNRSHFNENTAGSPFSEARNYKLKNQKNITIGHLNVNSWRNKFISIEELIKSKLDIFLVSEKKIDHSFPNQQFLIDGYKIYRREREKQFWWRSFYDQTDSNFEGIFPEIHYELKNGW